MKSENFPAQRFEPPIEEVVRAHILELTAWQAKTANANVSEADMAAVIDEALLWARKS